MFPNVVVGELSVLALFVLRNASWCFSNNCVAPREEPILIPKLSEGFQPACSTAFLEV